MECADGYAQRHCQGLNRARLLKAKMDDCERELKQALEDRILVDCYQWIRDNFEEPERDGECMTMSLLNELREYVDHQLSSLKRHSELIDKQMDDYEERLSKVEAEHASMICGKMINVMKSLKKLSVPKRAAKMEDLEVAINFWKRSSSKRLERFATKIDEEETNPILGRNCVHSTL